MEGSYMLGQEGNTGTNAMYLLGQEGIIDTDLKASGGCTKAWQTDSAASEQGPSARRFEHSKEHSCSAEVGN